jgi:streptomycin 6-kinase
LTPVPGSTADLPAAFRRRVTATFAPDGVAWLEALPTLLAACAQRWDLTLLPAFGNLSYNYVAPAVARDGAAVVLKVGVPNPELRTEIEALRRYSGRGAVRLLAADAELGALVMERLVPGTPLSDEPDDDQATAHAAQVMQTLWRPAPRSDTFPTLTRWFEALRRLRTRFDGGTGPLPPATVVLAEDLAVDLLRTSGAPVLLHGDLHHDNILAGERESWLAIDPKGVVGEAGYEVGAFLRNPGRRVQRARRLDRLLARRVARLAGDLGLDRQRLVAWGVAHAVLSACWTIEDGGDDWQPSIRCAETLARLLP